MNDQDAQDREAFKKWYRLEYGIALEYKDMKLPSSVAWHAALAYARQKQCRWVDVRKHEVPDHDGTHFVVHVGGVLGVAEYHSTYGWQMTIVKWLDGVPPVPKKENYE